MTACTLLNKLGWRSEAIDRQKMRPDLLFFCEARQRRRTKIRARPTEYWTHCVRPGRRRTSSLRDYLRADSARSGFPKRMRFKIDLRKQRLIG